MRVTRRGWTVLTVAIGLALTGSRWALSELTDPPAWSDAAGVPATSPVPSPSVAPTPTPSPSVASPPPLPGDADVRELTERRTRVGLGDDVDPTHAVAEALFETAPLVVVVDGSTAARDVGAWLALRMRAPLLRDGPGIAATMDALATRAALAVGTVGDLPVDDVREVPVVLDDGRWEEPRSRDAARVRLEERRWGVARLRALMGGAPPAHRPDLAVLGAERGRPWYPGDEAATVLIRRGDPPALEAVVSAVAAGHHVAALGAADPRRDPRATEELSGLPLDRLVLLGSPDAWSEVRLDALRWQLAVAQRGLELPGGGQVVFPGRRIVALYGTPGSGALGVLGEQPVDAAVDRAQRQAAAYDPYSDVPVVAAFEIIATIASGSAGADGDYSSERDVATLRPWVDAAAEAGLFVVLDLQPGRTDFLTQARRYRELLERPHVGLALDPEWRLRPTQRHLTQIGSVDADEVNRVSRWLARIVRRNRLPQKLLVIHQFKLSMIGERSALEARPELATLIQMDGQGGQAVKLDTWRAIRRDPPPSVWWGWKNFHDEDRPMRSPEETMSLDPPPVFISYQ